MHSRLRPGVIRLCPYLCAALIGALSGCAGEATAPTPGTVNPSGGTLSFAGGAVTLDVPAGAVSQPTTITVGVATGFPADPMLVPETAFDFGPDGTQFAVPVLLTVRYDRRNVPAGGQEADLRLFRVNGGAWVEVAGSSVDAGTQSVSGNITEFSVYAILSRSVIEAPVASVVVTPASTALTVGGSVQLTAVVRDADDNPLNRSVSWSTSNADVATVTEDGLVSAVGVGDAIITATSEGQSGNAEIAVSEASDAPPALQLVMEGFDSPVYLTAPPGDVRHLFVVEQGGVIRIIEDGQLLPASFLDLSGLVSRGTEQGLLSLAFHPDYAANGFFFVNYTDSNGDTQVVRYTVSADPNLADPASAKPILTVAQPYSNHNGGLLMFGADGMLYIGMGDGGSGGDPDGNGQNLMTLLGALLRIDVDGGDPYAIPSDNPFAGDPNARDEIWAYGLRNPWRFAFDRDAAMLYIADVGQSSWEEVNVSAASAAPLNYGWNIMEGLHCYEAQSCDQAGLTLPVLEYSHSDGCSVTGGFVYRGNLVPSVRGHYFYSDYCSGWLRSFRYDNGQAVDQTQWDVGAIGQVLSFGEDASRELYLLTADGRVYKLVPAG